MGSSAEDGEVDGVLVGAFVGFGVDVGSGLVVGFGVDVGSGSEVGAGVGLVDGGGVVGGGEDVVLAEVSGSG